MPIGTILLILQILGAMPQAIEFAKQLYELIKQIRDRRVRRQYRVELRRTIWDKRSSAVNVSHDECITCMGELDDLARKVQDQLRKERGYV